MKRALIGLMSTLTTAFYKKHYELLALGVLLSGCVFGREIEGMHL